jgi:isopenicillin-N N-acyltransferase-like protein
MKTQLTSFMSDVWAYLELQVDQAINSTLSPFFPPATLQWLSEVGLEAGLDATSDLTEAYTGAWFFQEMQGMSDATGVSYDTIRRIHMIVRV